MDAPKFMGGHFIMKRASLVLAILFMASTALLFMPTGCALMW